MVKGYSKAATGMSTVRKSFTLDAERDAALLAWLDAQPNTSEAIRDALRAAFDARNAGATLGDVLQAIEALGETLAGLQITSAPAGDGASEAEDPDLAAALESLGI
jgi:Arc/MetJ-type ribon-helix-helix transcriptional regulator